MVDFIPTRVSKVKKDSANGYVSVNYEKPKKKRKDSANENQEENDVQKSKFNVMNNKREDGQDQRKKQEREMKRIRYEVMKFGMSGFEKAKAEEAKVALAISLGAKPPKKKSINYKELQEQRKNRKKKVEHVSGLEKSLMKYKLKKTHKTNKKNSNDILGVYGKVSKISGKNKR